MPKRGVHELVLATLPTHGMIGNRPVATMPLSHALSGISGRVHRLKWMSVSSLSNKRASALGTHGPGEILSCRVSVDGTQTQRVAPASAPWTLPRETRPGRVATLGRLTHLHVKTNQDKRDSSCRKWAGYSLQHV